MSRFLLVLSLLAGMMLSAAGVASAQDTATDVDVAAIADTALGADPEALVTGLETPPDDAELPEGFVNPPSGVPENADLVEQFTGAIGDIDGAIGNVNHAFDTDPEVVPGLLSSGILTYIVTEEEITADALDQFEEGASQGLDPATPAAGPTAASATPTASDPTTEGSVERIDLGGVEAVVVNVGVELGGVNAVVQIVAVPVGNTMVIGTVLVADQGEVDSDAVLTLAEDLTLAGASYLEQISQRTPNRDATGDQSQPESNTDDLEATIAALEDRINEEDSDSTLPPAVPTNAPLEILSITTKDAGIGDGSLYAYVEVANNSGRLYSYVGLEGTCRSANGGIIGTGFGNTANVASGSTVVITMIFLQVPGCTDIEVRFDSLTGFQ